MMTIGRRAGRTTALLAKCGGGGPCGMCCVTGELDAVVPIDSSESVRVQQDAVRRGSPLERRASGRPATGSGVARE